MNLFERKRDGAVKTAKMAAREQTTGEEIANSVIHGVGALAATAGLVLLCVRSRLTGSAGGVKTVTSLALFAGTMITMFLASTLYHSIQHGGAKKTLKVLDHSAIYLFIAGTYTPFCLLALGGPLGWTLFSLEWACAAAGITLYAVNWRFLKKAELAVYLVMGWAIVVSAPLLRHRLTVPSAVFLIAGGVLYSLGVIWYTRKAQKGAHVVWHAFVLAGALAHWWAVWFL